MSDSFETLFSLLLIAAVKIKSQVRNIGLIPALMEPERW